MAPFPETEIMTLKRLEVAIRKMDFKLLKDGAYKLHEKYHGGHKFEYIDLLEEIYANILNNDSIPSEIKDLLIPTIEDILNGRSENSSFGFENKKVNEPRVSSLTSLSYGSSTAEAISTADAVENEIIKETQPITTDNSPVAQATETEPAVETLSEFTPFSEVSGDIPKENLNQPFQEFNSLTSIKEEIIDKVEEKPISETENLNEVENNPDEAETINKVEEQTLGAAENASLGETEPQTLGKVETLDVIEPQTPDEVGILGEAEKQIPDAVGADKVETLGTAKIPDEVEAPQIQSIRTIAKPKTEEFEIERRLKTVSIFYGQENSKERTKNITKLKELISKSKTENVSLDEIIKLIFEVKTQVNTNVAELRTILEQLKHYNNEVNLVTNSASSNLVSLLKETDARFSFMKRKENANLNVVTMFGLSNMYSCSNCDEKYLNWDENKIDPFILSCPKCKGAMYSTLFTQENPNINYYNYAVTSLANSNVWLVMHPALHDEFTINLFKTALNISSEVKEIYIVDKDINSREVLRNTLLETLNNSAKIKIDTQMGAMENFFNAIR